MLRIMKFTSWCCICGLSVTNKRIYVRMAVNKDSSLDCSIYFEKIVVSLID